MISVETFATIQQASGALNGSAAYLGGGTLIMRSLNYGEQNFERIIRSSDSALKTVRDAGDRIVIGAGVTMTQVMTESNLAFLSPVARSIGGPAIRNMATVGGNLFAPHPYGDFTVALLALNGIVTMDNGSELDMEQFLSTRNTITGIVSSVSIMKPHRQEFRYNKVSRVKPKGISVMSIAVWLPVSTGRPSNVRIAFGAMGVTPLRAKSAERALEGASIDVSGIAPALQAVEQDFNPPDDAIASGWYRSQVAPVHLKRLLLGGAQ